MTQYFWLSQPASFKKCLKPLLHQQLWLFGRDIVCPRGNLLYEYDFTHERAETRGCSMYTWQQGGVQVVLWGWGIWFGVQDTGAVFVHRYKAKPRFSAESKLTQSIHQPHQLPLLAYRVPTQAHALTMRALWQRLLLWLSDYEAWVLASHGRDWRKATLRSFNHAVTNGADVAQLPAVWHQLADKSQTLPIKSYSRNRNC